jgi:acetolactate synthase-1/2/3 large subunit
MTQQHDGGDAILNAFRSLGIEYILSSPGSEWAPVWEALARQKLGNLHGPTFMDCWHENLAINIAAGYTQYTGRMQAVLVHAGVGLLQGALGIHTARNFELPMLVMSGESVTFGEDPNIDPGEHWYRNLGIVGGPHRLVEPLTKWAGQATSIHTLYEQTVRAGEISRHNPQAPAYLSVPLEHMLLPWTPQKSTRSAPNVPKLRPSVGDIDKVAALIEKAERPLIITDSVGRDADAFHALVRFADLMALPVADSTAVAYANFPKDNPLYLGMTGGAAFLDEADLILLLKSRTPWYPPRNCPAGVPVVAISENPIKAQYPHQNLQADCYLEGDVASTVDLLAAASAAAAAKNFGKLDERRGQIASAHDRWEKRLRGAEAAAAGRNPIDPLWLFGAMRSILPEDTVYLDETIVHGNLLREHLPWNLPRSFFNVGAGLGQGLGVALGVKLAAPERPVVLLIGDGSFLYNPVVQALGASQQYGLPLLIVVCNNQKYSAMQMGHTQYYPQGTAIERNIWYGVDIKGPEYSELGKPFGFQGQRVEKAAELPGSLKNGLDSIRNGQTYILNVVLSR